jgi:uncharacterized protein YndB with AHSA1/START domain
MPSVTSPLGEIRRAGGRAAVRFDRIYLVAVADVWTAITDPARIAGWLGEIQGACGVGERVRIVLSERSEAVVDVDIRRRVAPDELSVTWTARLELTWTVPGEDPTELYADLHALRFGHTRIVLDHAGFTPESVADRACAWHHRLDTLDAYLSGVPLPPLDAYYPAMLEKYR